MGRAKGAEILTLGLHPVGETLNRARSHHLAETGKLVRLLRGIHASCAPDLNKQRPIHRLVRHARLAAVFSARHARYVSRSPFEATSREILEGALPSRVAICRRELPSSSPRESSSRSARDSRSGVRSRTRGLNPPVRAIGRATESKRIVPRGRFSAAVSSKST